MNNINTRLDRSNIFYELDNLVLFGEHPEVEMDCLTPEGKVDLYENLMHSWDPDARVESIRSKVFDEEVESPSYEELVDFVSFDSPAPKAKSLDEKTFPSKDLKDKVTGSPAAAIAGTSLLVSSVFFVMLAILCPHGSLTLFALYTALSAATTASGGALLASTLIDKKHPFGMYNLSRKT
jgi:hypothetical protein